MSNVIEKSLIDCIRPPYIPQGYAVSEHKEGGLIEWNPEKIDLLGELSRESLNANVLDYLLENPHLIPEEWKSKYVFFWGTVYSRSTGHKCVRCLGWHEEWKWFWSSRSVDLVFDSKRLAAVLKIPL
jgi:hypothetical protein